LDSCICLRRVYTFLIILLPCDLVKAPDWCICLLQACTSLVQRLCAHRREGTAPRAARVTAESRVDDSHEFHTNLRGSPFLVGATPEDAQRPVELDKLSHEEACSVRGWLSTPDRRNSLSQLHAKEGYRQDPAELSTTSHLPEPSVMWAVFRKEEIARGVAAIPVHALAETCSKEAREAGHGGGNRTCPSAIQFKRDDVSCFTEPRSVPVHSWLKGRPNAWAGLKLWGSAQVDHAPVFISHRSEYGRVARALKQVIETSSHGQIDVFISEDIPRGDEWRASIEKDLRDGQSLFLIYGAPYEDCSWCFYEAGYFAAVNPPTV
jgi:hypothetical protein